MAVRLYWITLSHPSQAARKMLELKRVDYKIVNVLPFNQRVHLRLAGFKGGTVPAIKFDGRRVQGSREIAQALDQRWPEPPLFPSDPELRKQIEQAERWGEQQLQPVPRRISRYGVAHDVGMRVWGARASHMRRRRWSRAWRCHWAHYYNLSVESDGRRATAASVQTDLKALPGLLYHADQLLSDGILATDPPNAATLQILASVCLFDALADLHEAIGGRPCAVAARAVFPDYPRWFPRFLPAEWLAAFAG